MKINQMNYEFKMNLKRLINPLLNSLKVIDPEIIRPRVRPVPGPVMIPVYKNLPFIP